MSKYPLRYNGPEGFGGNPETGGDETIGKNRMTSLEPWRTRLGPAAETRIRKIFKDYDVKIRQIDKVYRYGVPYLRVSYNGELHG